MSSKNGHYKGRILPCPVELQNLNDLEPQVYLIPIRGKQYYVHEPLSKDIISIRNARQAMMKFDGEGKAIGIGNVYDLDLTLVQKCTYRPDDNGNLKTVSLSDGTVVPDEQMRVDPNVVRNWTNDIQSKLHKLISKMGNLDEEEETIESLEMKIQGFQKLLDAKKRLRSSAKNEPLPTTTTSDEPTDRDVVSSNFSE